MHLLKAKRKEPWNDWIRQWEVIRLDVPQMLEVLDMRGISPATTAFGEPLKRQSWLGHDGRPGVAEVLPPGRTHVRVAVRQELYAANTAGTESTAIMDSLGIPEYHQIAILGNSVAGTMTASSAALASSSDSATAPRLST